VYCHVCTGSVCNVHFVETTKKQWLYYTAVPMDLNVGIHCNCCIATCVVAAQGEEITPPKTKNFEKSLRHLLSSNSLKHDEGMRNIK
jgi:hypothetical protein